MVATASADTETGLQTAQVLKTENAAETFAGSAPRDTVLG
jgi:hypothetical protein